MNNKFLSILEYSLNKFMPYVLISFLVFFEFGFYKVQPYIIMGLLCFLDKHSFRVGYAVALCEQKGIDLEKWDE